MNFDNFIADMGERPPQASIDRIDTNGDYEPDNCHWIPANQQQRNRRTTKLDAVSVMLLRYMRRRGSLLDDLAHAFGISAKTVMEVASGRRWNNLMIPPYRSRKATP
jgi:hypothetical protein